MKNKLRKIQIDGMHFFWRVLWDPDAANGDFLFLRIWIAGHKARPWVTVHYQYHSPWLFYGDIIAATTAQQRKKAGDYFQLKPLMPGQVAEIIRSAMVLLEEKYSNKLIIEDAYFNVDREGCLHWGLSPRA